jgi:L-asparaginase II
VENGLEDNIKMNLQANGMGRHGLDCSGSGQGQVAGCCKCGNEHPGYIKCREFLD